MYKFEISLDNPSDTVSLFCFIGVIVTTIGFLWFVVCLFLKYILKKSVRVKYALLTFLAGFLILFTIAAMDTYEIANIEYDKTIEQGTEIVD